jgi:drug/metabolite transporter (DMT)-like permease
MVGVVSLLLTLMAPLGALMASAYLGTPVTASDWLAIAITAFGVAFPSLADRFGRRIALARRR